MEQSRRMLAWLAMHRSFRLFLIVAIFAAGIGSRLAGAYFARLGTYLFSEDLIVLHDAAQFALEGKDVYAITLQTWPINQFLAYPAGILWMSVGMLELSSFTGISFLYTAQSFATAFDTTIAILVLMALRSEPFYRKIMGLLLAFFNPFLFWNTVYAVKPEDTFMLALTLGALCLLEMSKFGKASVVMGVALASKPFPVLLLPYFVYRIAAGRRKRCILYLAAAFATASLPYIVTEPVSYLTASFLVHVSRPAESEIRNPFIGLLTLRPDLATHILVLAILLAVIALIYLEFSGVDSYTFTFLMAFAFVSFYWVAGQQYFTWFVPFVIVSVLKRMGHDQVSESLR